MKKLMVVGSTLLIALSLAACSSSNSTKAKKQSKISRIEKQLKKDAKKKQALSETQWNLENKREYYVSKGDFNSLSKISGAVFANQRATTKVNSDMDSLNQKLAKLSHKHKHVDNNGDVVYYPVIVPSYTATAATNTTTTHADEEETTAHTTETESTAHTTEAPEAHTTVSTHAGK